MMDHVRNERTKLTANALNTAATSSFTIGVLAPIAAAFYNVGNPNRVPLAALVLGAFVWLCCAVALHLAARYVLRGLRP